MPDAPRGRQGQRGAQGAGQLRRHDLLAARRPSPAAEVRPAPADALPRARRGGRGPAAAPGVRPRVRREPDRREPEGDGQARRGPGGARGPGRRRAEALRGRRLRAGLRPVRAHGPGAADAGPGASRAGAGPLHAAAREGVPRGAEGPPGIAREDARRAEARLRLARGRRDPDEAPHRDAPDRGRAGRLAVPHEQDARGRLRWAPRRHDPRRDAPERPPGRGRRSRARRRQRRLLQGARQRRRQHRLRGRLQGRLHLRLQAGGARPPGHLRAPALAGHLPGRAARRAAQHGRAAHRRRLRARRRDDKNVRRRARRAVRAVHGEGARHGGGGFRARQEEPRPPERRPDPRPRRCEIREGRRRADAQGQPPRVVRPADRPG